MPKARILIIGNNYFLAELLKILLKRIGYEYIGIINPGEGFISKILDLKPDIVLLDLVLGEEMDGIKTTILLKENYEIPAILLTTYGNIKTSNKGNINELHECILKPITHEKDLLPSFKKVLNNNKTICKT